MMMHAVNVSSDLIAVSSQEREQLASYGDEHYQPNPNGFYEPSGEDVRRLNFPLQFEGKLVKIMVQRIETIAVGDYRLVLMQRDPEEIRQSFEAFTGNKAKDIERYDELFAHTLKQLQNRKDMDITVLQYREVVESPDVSFNTLANNGWPIDVSKAVSVINPDLYRFRRENLIKGI